MRQRQVLRGEALRKYWLEAVVRSGVIVRPGEGGAVQIIETYHGDFRVAPIFGFGDEPVFPQGPCP